MAKATPIDKLAETIDKVLAEYGTEVTGLAKDAVKAVTKAGVAAVKAEAKSKLDVNGSSEYVMGWTSTVETGRVSAQGTIYNRKVPGLPHLLEYGHVSRNGTGRTFGRVPGRVHIAPVQKLLSEQLYQTIRRKI